MAADIIVSISAQACHCACHARVVVSSDANCDHPSQSKLEVFECGALITLLEANPAMPPRGKWKNLGDVALEQGTAARPGGTLWQCPSCPGDFTLAKRCFSEAKDP